MPTAPSNFQGPRKPILIIIRRPKNKKMIQGHTVGAESARVNSHLVPGKHMHTSGCRHIPNSSSAIVGGSRKKGGVRIESAGNDTPTVALKAREHPGDTSGHVCVAKSFVWCNYYLQKTRAARFPLPNIPFRLVKKNRQETPELC